MLEYTGISTPFSRIGNKSRQKDVITTAIPYHKLYIEPFVGSGAIYFHKKPAKKSILNDLDKDIINAFKLAKKIDIDQGFKTFNSVDEIQEFVNKNTANNNDKFMQLLYKQHNTYGNMGKGKIYRDYSLKNIINKIDDVKKKLLETNTTILNKDGLDVIVKFADNRNAFFFIDPPYDDTDRLYKNEVDLEVLNEILKKIKGRFLITLNDSVKNRKLFNKFNIKGVKIKSPSVKGIGGQIPRKEIWISNYNIDSVNALK